MDEKKDGSPKPRKKASDEMVCHKKVYAKNNLKPGLLTVHCLYCCVNVGFSFLDDPETIRTCYNLFWHRKMLRDDKDETNEEEEEEGDEEEQHEDRVQQVEEEEDLDDEVVLDQDEYEEEDEYVEEEEEEEEEDEEEDEEEEEEDEEDEEDQEGS